MIEINLKLWEKIIRAVVGAVVVILIYIGLGNFFSSCGVNPKFIKFTVQFLMEMTILFFGSCVMKLKKHKK